MPWWNRHFLIGSDEHLRNLGLLTLDFGAADEALAQYIESLISIVGSMVGVDQGSDLIQRAKDQPFSAKIRILRTLVQSLTKRYGLDDSVLLRRLDAVNRISDYRNAVVHGWVTVDAQRGPLFRNKRRPPRSASAFDIEQVCKQLQRWFGDMADSYTAFLNQLHERLTKESLDAQ